jgi:hypothetical protein
VHYLLIALACAPLFAPVPSEGTVRYSPGFPLAIPKSGIVLIKACARAESGYTLHTAKVLYFENGGPVSMQRLSIDTSGNLGPAIIRGLTPAKRYMVMVEVVQSRPGEDSTLTILTDVLAR